MGGDAWMWGDRAEELLRSEVPAWVKAPAHEVVIARWRLRSLLTELPADRLREGLYYAGMAEALTWALGSERVRPPITARSDPPNVLTVRLELLAAYEAAVGRTMPEHIYDDVDADHWPPRPDVSVAYAAGAGMLLTWLVGWSDTPPIPLLPEVP